MLERETKKNYLEIPLPRLNKLDLKINHTFLTLVLVLLLMVSSFALGSFYTKMRYLENSQTANSVLGTTQNNNTAIGEFVKYAKTVGLDTKNFEACLTENKYNSKIQADINQAGQVGVSGTPGIFINGKFLGGAFPYEAFKDIIDKEIAGIGSEDYSVYSEMLKQTYEESQGKSFNPAAKNVDIGKSQVLGDNKAQITIIEFSDFQCPYSNKVQATLDQIKQEYKDKVRFVYKHLPLNFHSNAQKAAEASECAGEQGKFWQYHDLLYKNQSTWSSLPSAS